MVGCLSLKIVKIIGFPLEKNFCLRFRLTCRCDPDGVTPIIKCMVITALSVKCHTKIQIFFFFWPGYSQKNAFLKRAKKKRVYATLRFSRVYFNLCHPGDDTGNENTDSLQIIRGSGRSATLAKSKFK